MGIHDAAMSEEESKELQKIQARQGIVYKPPIPKDKKSEAPVKIVIYTDEGTKEEFQCDRSVAEEIKSDMKLIRGDRDG